MTARIDVIIDLPPGHRYHQATLAAVGHAAHATAGGTAVDVRAVRTPEIDDAYLLSLPHGVVIGPGTPYEVPEAADAVVLGARERGVPLVGT